MLLRDDVRYIFSYNAVIITVGLKIGISHSELT